MGVGDVVAWQGWYAYIVADFRGLHPRATFDFRLAIPFINSEGEAEIKLRVADQDDLMPWDKWLKLQQEREDALHP